MDLVELKSRLQSFACDNSDCNMHFPKNRFTRLVSYLILHTGIYVVHLHAKPLFLHIAPLAVLESNSKGTLEFTIITGFH